MGRRRRNIVLLLVGIVIGAITAVLLIVQDPASPAVRVRPTAPPASEVRLDQMS